MVDWPKPKTLKALSGFFGLTSYYRRFIKGYGSIAAALIALLRKNNFHWGEAAETAFLKLKEALTQPPVLALPDFSKPFFIECDAPGRGVRAVLISGSDPFHLLSRP